MHMFNWFKIKSPLTAEQRQTIDDRYAWLEAEFGDRWRTRPTITPSEEFFPDRYTPTHEGVLALFDRLCKYMSIERDRIDLRFYTSQAADDVVAAFRGDQQKFALGYYQERPERLVITLEDTRWTNRMRLLPRWLMSWGTSIYWLMVVAAAIGPTMNH